MRRRGFILGGLATAVAGSSALAAPWVWIREKQVGKSSRPNILHLGPKNHWHKYSLWDEASQTVFAMAGPGVASGALSLRTVSLDDIYPTICQICDLQAPHELAGRSLTPLMRDPRAEWHRPALTTWRRGNHAVRSERYRYIRYRDGEEELYDHVFDPHEWYNIAGTERVRPIIDAHARWLPGAGPSPDRDDERTQPWIGLVGDRRALLPDEAG